MSRIQIQRFVFNPFQENTYVLFDDSKACLLVDPGCYHRHEQAELQVFVEDNGLRPEKLVNTHCHIDHVLGNQVVSETWGLPVHAHPEDAPTLQMVPMSAHLYGIDGYQTSPEPVWDLREGTTVTFGDSALEVLHVPGHAPGHVVLVHHEQEFIIGGDVLFRGSIGRTDLPGGDHDTLIRSIREQLWPLGDAYTVWPGHGPETTIDLEKRTNPFFQG